MANQVSDLDVRRVSFVKRGAVRDPENPSEPHRRLLWKAEDGLDANTGGASAPATEGGSMTTEQYKAALAKAETDRDEALRKQQEAEQQLAKAQTASDDDGDEGAEQPGKDGEFEKSELPAAVREALEKAERREAELLQKAEEAERIAKQERELRETREWIAKAESELPHIGSPEVLGPRLLRMSQSLSKEDFEAQLQDMRAASEQLATGALFAEHGRDGQPSRGGDAATAALAKSEEIRKAQPDLTPSQAYAEAMRDPEIRKSYLAEQTA